MELITFLDVEASGLQLPDSYPIEVAWSDTLGNHDTFLIVPEPSWTHWDPVAECVHGIPRNQLFSDGISVANAAGRLDRALGIETVYCDSVDFDGHWLRRLFDSAGIGPSFVLADIRELYGKIGVECTADMQRLLAELPVPHRALADAERYVAAYQKVMGSDARLLRDIKKGKNYAN